MYHEIFKIFYFKGRNDLKYLDNFNRDLKYALIVAIKSKFLDFNLTNF